MGQSENMLQSVPSLVFDNPYTGILTLDRQLRINSWNRALVQWFQIAQEEVQGCSIKEVLTDISTEKFNKLTTPPLVHNTSVSEFLTFSIANETSFHIQSAPILDSDGNAQGVQMIFLPYENNSGEVPAKNKGNLTEFIQPLIDEFAESVFIVDQKGYFIRVNKAALDLCGYTKEELFKLRFSDLIHEDDIDANPLIVKDKPHEQPWLSEFRLLTKNNQPRYVESSAHILESGYIQIVKRDISERKHSDQKLRYSEEQYRLLFTHNPEPILLCDATNLEVLDANKACTTLYNYTTEELKQLSIDQLHPSEERQKFYNYLANLSQEDGKLGIWTHCKKDGTLLRVEIISYALSMGGRKTRIVMLNDLTEKVTAIENLRESEEKFKVLTENSLVGVYMFSGATYDYVNPKMAEIIGYTPDEVINQIGPRDIVHPEDWPDIENKIQKLLNGERESVNTELRLIDKHHHVRYIDAYASTIHFYDQPTIIGTTIDITERKEAEHELVYNEKLLQNVFDQSQDALFIIRSEDEIIEDCNPMAVEMFNMDSKEELIGQTIFKLKGAEFSQEQLDQVKQQVSEGKQWSTDHLLETKDNQKFWGSIVIKRFTLNDRTMSLVRITDIDEKMRNKQKLQEEQQFVEAITQNTPNIIQLYDVNKNAYVYANRNLQEFLGYTTEELNNFENGVLDLFAKEDIPALQKRLQDNLKLKDGQVQTTEFRIQLKDGHWVWLLAYDTVFKRDDEGNVQQILGTLQDITERKNAELKLANFNEELEQEVQERTKELEHANKELEAFNYTVSHDLRNPLRAIEIFSSFLEKKYYEALDNKGKEYIAQIRTSVRNITQLLDDLLAFSRIGRKEKSDEEFSMTELFQEVIQENKYYYEDNPNPSIELNDLPSVVGDRQMMRHVALNLIANAMKFSKYEQYPTITISSYKDDDRIVFFVSDNGIGFDMNYVDKIFGVFERLHTDTEFEGTGGGLSIVERVIQRHNGTVWAEGEKGKGATIYFSLPANVSK